MSSHDPLCRNRWNTKTEVGSCLCALIARVRADERERWGLGWIAAADNVAALAHAEAVAARLVEVIWRQEWTRQIHVETIHDLSTEADVLENQRDAARAEVAALRDAELEALGATFEAGQPLLIDRNHAVRIARGES